LSFYVHVVWAIMYSSLLRVIAPLLVTMAAVTSSMGMYDIDDTDSSIIWHGPFIPLNASFAPITWANADLCFNKTFTVGQGTTDQGHSFEIPFTGTGISLFVAYNNRLGLNVSVTLDNDFTTINWFILDTDYSTPTYTTYNATLYDMQNLTDGNHVVNIVLQDYMGNQSDIMFDYAGVTGDKPAVRSGSSTKEKIGAGIGGGLGALAIIVAIAFIVLFSRRRTRRKTSSMELDLIDSDAKDPSMFHQASSNVTTAFRPGHNRRQSSFSQSSASPISPVKPTYSKFLGQKHPFHQLPT